MNRGDPRRHALRVSSGRWTSRRSPSWDVLWAGKDGDDGVIPTRRVLSDRVPWATAPASPAAALYNPQGARLCGPAASSNSSYVPCHQPLCESPLSTPARHIRSYPMWVNAPGQPCSTPDRYVDLPYSSFCLEKPPDTVGQPPNTEICVSNMPSLKAKKLRKLSQEKVLLEL